MSNGVTSGDWLNTALIAHDIYTKLVIASTTWFIWKARCNRIFRNEPLNCLTVYKSAIGHVREYSSISSIQIGKHFIQFNFSISDTPIIFVTANWNQATSTAGIGFLAVDTTPKFLRAGSCSVAVDSEVNAEAKALIITLKILLDWHFHPRHILFNDAVLIEAIKRGHPLVAWRLSHGINNIGCALSEMNNPCLHVISRNWNPPAICLATLRRNLHEINLFHHGRELPKWIMKTLHQNGIFVFISKFA